MRSIPETTPVEDSVRKVNDEFAVGSDIDFQRKWEKFERVVWIFLIILIVLSMAGVFGRGPVAKARTRASDGSMEVTYERIQRSGTPSVMTVHFPQSSVAADGVKLWVSDALVKPLGTQRIVPQPTLSVLSAGGILYTFSATTVPLSVEFQTQPSSLGSSELDLQVFDKSMVRLHIFVMP